MLAFAFSFICPPRVSCSSSSLDDLDVGSTALGVTSTPGRSDLSDSSSARWIMASSSCNSFFLAACSSRDCSKAALNSSSSSAACGAAFSTPSAKASINVSFSPLKDGRSVSDTVSTFASSWDATLCKRYQMYAIVFFCLPDFLLATCLPAFAYFTVIVRTPTSCGNLIIGPMKLFGPFGKAGL